MLKIPKKSVLQKKLQQPRICLALFGFFYSGGLRAREVREQVKIHSYITVASQCDT